MPIMEYATCNVIYVDRNARACRLVKRGDATMALLKSSTASGVAIPTSRDAPESDVFENLEVLLENFSAVHLCNNGKSCMATLADLDAACVLTLVPTIVLIDIPFNEKMDAKSIKEDGEQSPSSSPVTDRFPEKDGNFYGLKLLQWIMAEIKCQSLSKLIVPLAYVTIPEPQDSNQLPSHTQSRSKSKLSPVHQDHLYRRTLLDPSRTLQYLDIGAVDVLPSPFPRDRLPGLATHAYRAHKETAKEQRALAAMKRGRKRSWVGLDDQKPYAYLREAMVSGLMDGICKLGEEDEDTPGHIKVVIQSTRREKIGSAIGVWHFSAHEFSDDELLHGAMLMLQHALSMPELKNFRITAENLTGFLVASRSAYNTFVPYHNFRHVVDVLQATFSFLVAIGSLPRFPAESTETTKTESREQSPLAALIKPVDALTLMIAAIGHDVGHPGVNNAFLVNLNAPLAQLYNDRSVLEAFHCAAFSQILRRHWPAAFCDRDMRELMISTILATDMGLHFDYMKKLGFLQEKLAENGGTEGWNGRVLDEQKTLACSLIIKCADISNVARSFDVATQWTMILNEEWARQALMEQDLSIPSALLSPPVREMVEIGKGLLGFMNMIVIPLFQGVADVMPDMSTGLQQLQLNKSMWERRISRDQDKHRKFSDDSLLPDGVISPRSLSVATPPVEAADGISIGSGKNSSFPPRLVRSRSEEAARSADLVKIFVGGIPHSTLDLDRESNTTKDSPSHTVPETFPSVSLISPEYTVDGHLSSSVPVSPGDVRFGEASVKHSRSGHQETDGTDSTLVNGFPLEVCDDTSESGPSDLGRRNLVNQRSSETTDGRNSMPGSGDWASQATSATTNKIPYSPSTRGTSVTSRESRDRLVVNGEHSQALAKDRDKNCDAVLENSHIQINAGGASPDKRSTTSETDDDTSRPHRLLKQKSSLFRLPKFWHRKGSSEREAVTTGGKEHDNNGRY